MADLEKTVELTRRERRKRSVNDLGSNRSADKPHPADDACQETDAMPAPAASSCLSQLLLEKPHQGQNDFRCGNGLETDWFSEAKKEKLERLSCEKKLWMAAGQAALDRHKRLQPHRQFSVSMIARLLDIGSVLGRISVGLPLC